MKKLRGLLEPTLSGESTQTPAIHSATTGYLAAFLGGPIGGALVALENARRLRRLSSDWWLGAVGVASTAALMWWERRAGGLEWLVARFGSGGPRFGLRILGLAFFALAYLVHRRYYRNMAFYGIPAPSGWILGFAAIVIGALATAGLAMALAR
jgi:hypothetical protein